MGIDPVIAISALIIGLGLGVFQGFEHVRGPVRVLQGLKLGLQGQLEVYCD